MSRVYHSFPGSELFDNDISAFLTHETSPAPAEGYLMHVLEWEEISLMIDYARQPEIRPLITFLVQSGQSRNTYSAEV